MILRALFVALILLCAVNSLSAQAPTASNRGNPPVAFEQKLPKLTTGQRSQWHYLQGLMRRFIETTDHATRDSLAREYLTGSRGLREIFENYPEYWRDRARLSLEVANDKAGREAAERLLKFNLPEDALLLTRLRQRGWAQDGSEKSRLGGDFIIKALQLSMIYVEPGSFTMGSTLAPNEGPPTRVTISRPFWIGKFEITHSHWRAVYGNSMNDAQELGLPKVGISWLDAQDFCDRLNNFERVAGRLPAGYEYALPTEAQWEYACQAGSTDETVPNLDAVAWFADNSGGHLHAIGEKAPNTWGIHNMLGNASEWCRDYFTENHPGGEQTDPTGPAAGTLRSVRGGNYASPAGNCRPAKRGRAYEEGATGASEKVGFRIVLSWIGNRN